MFGILLEFTVTRIQVTAVQLPLYLDLRIIISHIDSKNREKIVLDVYVVSTENCQENVGWVSGKLVFCYLAVWEENIQLSVLEVT